MYILPRLLMSQTSTVWSSPPVHTWYLYIITITAAATAAPSPHSIAVVCSQLKSQWAGTRLGSRTYPFGDMSIARTPLRWLSRIMMHLPDRRSHILPHPSRPLQDKQAPKCSKQKKIAAHALNEYEWKVQYFHNKNYLYLDPAKEPSG